MRYRWCIVELLKLLIAPCVIDNKCPVGGVSTDLACCSQGGTRRHCQCFFASIASLAACYNSSSSYQHASNGNQFWRATRICQMGVEC
jgi:hypothetical protein